MSGWRSPNRRWLVVPAFVLVAAFSILWERWVGAPDPNAAVLYWQRQVEAHPEFALGHSRLGLAYERVEDWRSAESAYTTALALDPSLEEVAIGLSGVLRQTRGRPAAAAQLSSYLAIHPGCGVCSYNLASDYLVMGELELARAQIDRALINIGSASSATYGGGDLHSDALLLAGRIYMAVERSDEALGYLEGAIERRPDDVEAHLAIGRIRMGEDPAATVSYWQDFRELAPEDVRGPLFEARAQLAAGRHDDALRALDAAEAVVHASAAAKHWEFEIAFDRARVAFQRRDFDDARKRIRDLIDSSTEAEKIERAKKFLARIDASR